MGIMHIIFKRKEDPSPVFTTTNNITKHFCFHCLIGISQESAEIEVTMSSVIDKEIEN